MRGGSASRESPACRSFAGQHPLKRVSGAHLEHHCPAAERQRAVQPIRLQPSADSG